jgi:Na+-transporting NADH:ubiquinone oxidoreductase subunit NqrE
VLAGIKQMHFVVLFEHVAVLPHERGVEIANKEYSHCAFFSSRSFFLRSDSFSSSMADRGGSSCGLHLRILALSHMAHHRMSFHKNPVTKQTIHMITINASWVVHPQLLILPVNPNTKVITSGSIGKNMVIIISKVSSDS